MNIIIYGTGSSAEKFLNKIKNNINIICCLDSNDKKHGTKIQNYDICAPEYIENLKYDYVVITSQYVEDIYTSLMNFGVSSEKVIIFEDLLHFSKKVTENSYKLSEIIDENNNLALVSDLVKLDRKRLFDMKGSTDYVRHSTLELICNLIKEQSLIGELAELGVYRGDFAKLLNNSFPEKNLYLFDTFESFNRKDIIDDLEKGVIKKSYITKLDNAFKDTSDNFVLSRMPYPKKCIIKKGYFPESASNLEEKFCLVSIDVDLYTPILEGLRYFYPRLVERGYLLIHDYNNDYFKGVKDAIAFYEAELGSTLRKVPITDTGGTLIICK